MITNVPGCVGETKLVGCGACPNRGWDRDEKCRLHLEREEALPPSFPWEMLPSARPEA